MFHRITEAYETLVDPARRQHYDSTGKGGSAPPAATQSFEFAGFDFSVSAHGAQAATFTELFAEVLHPVGPGDRGRPEPGADLHATLTVSFLDARARRPASGREHAAGDLSCLPWQRSREDRRSAVLALPRDRTRALGTRAHGLCEAVCRVWRDRPAAAAAMRRLCGSGARGAERSGAGLRPAGHRGWRAAPHRRTRARRHAWRPHRRPVRDGARRAASAVPPRG